MSDSNGDKQVAQRPALLAVGFRFLLSGGLNTLATYLLYWALLSVLHYQVAYAVSFIAGIALSYALNTKFVFKAKHTAKKAALFPMIYLVTYLIGAATMKVSVSWLHLDPRIAPLVAIAVTLPVTFILSRRLLTRA